MASVQIFQGKGFVVSLTNEGMSPIPDSVNIGITTPRNGRYAGDITLSIEQMKQLKGLLELAIFAEQSARKANSNATS